METPSAPPEYNVTGLEFGRRDHIRYAGPPLIDFHCHVTGTRPDGSDDPPAYDQAALMLDVASEFGVGRLLTMCPPEDVAPLRNLFGDRLRYNGPISKKPDEPDDAAFRQLDRFLAAGISCVKLWAAPRGRERGLTLDPPWRIEALRRARAAGVRMVMVHVADPDAWFRTVYTDVEKFGTKPGQYEPLERLLAQFPDMTWIGAHLGGDPEHPDHLEALLEEHPHLVFDTSATKWQVREVSPRADAFRGLVTRHPTRFLFGSDLVTRHGLTREHYDSRYWCQRTLWESRWTGPSPIADADHRPPEGGQPTLCGVDLPADVLRLVYHDNAARLLGV